MSKLCEYKFSDILPGKTDDFRGLFEVSQGINRLLAFLSKLKGFGSLHDMASTYGALKVPSIHYEGSEATCNTSFIAAQRNVLRFHDSGSSFYLFPNGYHFGIYVPSANAIFVRESNVNSSLRIAAHIKSAEYRLKELLNVKGKSYLGVINGFGRPYHYFYERFPEVLRLIESIDRSNGVRLTLHTIKGRAFLDADDLNIDVKENKIFQEEVNEYLLKNSGFLLSPDILGFDRFSEPLLSYSRKISKSLSESNAISNIEFSNKKIFWVGLCEEHRSFVNKNEVINCFIKAAIFKFPNAFFVFDGLTRPVGVEKERFIQEKCQREVDSLKEIVDLYDASSDRKLQYLSLIGEKAAVKIKIAERVDFFSLVLIRIRCGLRIFIKRMV
jgi:hypothetical protein